MTAFTVIDVPQRSEAWFAARVGRVTSTGADPMLATISKGESAGRRNLRARLVLERLTGKPQESSFQSKAMEQGIDREADALALYEARYRSVRTCGFLRHDTLMAGASLDGYVGDFEGIVEVKSPIPATHLEYVKSGKIPLDYYRQITHQLWLTGARWADFVSFNPDFPEQWQLKVVRVERREDDLRDYETQLRAFLAEVDRELEALLALANLPATLQAAAGAGR